MAVHSDFMATFAKLALAGRAPKGYSVANGAAAVLSCLAYLYGGTSPMSHTSAPCHAS